MAYASRLPPRPEGQGFTLHMMKKISFKAAQLASFIVMLSALTLISISVYLGGQRDLASALKDLFPANTYIFVLVLLLGFGLVSFPLLIKSKIKNVSFKKEFLIHFFILSGVAITLLGLFSRVL